jgi:orotate phosphoribosyltransferase
VGDLQTTIAKALLEIDAVGFTPEQPIRFKSNILSPIYVDNRCLPYYPQQWHVVIEGFKTLLTQLNLQFDVIAGVAVGGVPHGAALAYALGKPSVFVRKEAKEHGRQNRIEGGSVAGRRVMLVEDLVTTGSSSLSAINALQEEQAIVENVLAIVTYGFHEAKSAFSSAGVQLHTLTNFHVILEQALQMVMLSPTKLSVIQRWFDDPYGWHP